MPTPFPSLRRCYAAQTFSKLCQMLDGPSRDAVGHWRDKADIVLIDQDSAVALGGGVLSGLTGKFEREGYAGKLWFVAGGHAAVEDQECVECVCEEGTLDANPTPSLKGSATLGIGRLPRLAFQHCEWQIYEGCKLTTAASMGARCAHAGGAHRSIHSSPSVWVARSLSRGIGDSQRVKEHRDCAKSIAACKPVL